MCLYSVCTCLYSVYAYTEGCVDTDTPPCKIRRTYTVWYLTGRKGCLSVYTQLREEVEEASSRVDDHLQIDHPCKIRRLPLDCHWVATQKPTAAIEGVMQTV